MGSMLVGLIFCLVVETVDVLVVGTVVLGVVFIVVFV
ncbi:hypothetical protein CAXC1_350018 [Candidatus Xenohaliotis californiensis]|uniref:Uncharacterized protein n=1 Tax=Candidatus Xenohaliotis californiensis TaxID=84677 RepID=A0ABP0EYF1_9RICK|nr:hypothetical protein CAXC1_350018 [Candidatus Xenohaliotis californiensis]